ncbi:hypothetical protein ILYODFUR_038738 [Ilyodon furcidens]|uniref:Uncharacterized protein n=1 Tax=Ilyodon furcidens TaxID=33524 RepID=A0ABV0SU69_9TELE
MKPCSFHRLGNLSLQPHDGAQNGSVVETRYSSSLCVSSGNTAVVLGSVQVSLPLWFHLHVWPRDSLTVVSENVLKPCSDDRFFRSFGSDSVSHLLMSNCF